MLPYLIELIITVLHLSFWGSHFTNDKEITTSTPSRSGFDQNNLADTITETIEAKPKVEKKSGTRVGQRKPKRDVVGHESQPENA